jgi:hypothetical protein
MLTGNLNLKSSVITHSEKSNIKALNTTSYNMVDSIDDIREASRSELPYIYKPDVKTHDPI